MSTDVSIHVRTAGSGPAVLLLHGYPETSSDVAARRPRLGLATSQSSPLTCAGTAGAASPRTPTPESYSKRRYGSRIRSRLMDALGHERFSVAGHDRGGRVAHRLGLDHPSRVERMAVLDIVPTLHMFENVDRAMAETYFHWFFLSQPTDLPERLITATRTAGSPAGSVGATDSSWSIGRRRPGRVRGRLR